MGRNSGRDMFRRRGLFLRDKMDKELMKQAINKAEEHRKYLHTIPEKGLEEYKTTSYIKEVCKDYPVELIDIGMETGAVYWLDAGKAETVGLRADIDALPSENGPQHLCGHDSHTATLLGAMDYLCAVKDSLPYNVLFVFQPAEEGTRGAYRMLEAGLFEKVPQKPVRMFGIHNRPEVDCGDVVVHKGPLMSEKGIYTITYSGVVGHASTPHRCIDPIVAAASFVTGLQTIVSKNIDPFKPVVCTVNSLTAGDPYIAAPRDAVITGYFRSFDHDTHVRMAERLKGLAENIAAAYECKCSIEVIDAVPVLDNPEELYDIAYRAAEAAVGEEHVVDVDPCLASEDFAMYGTIMPAFFFWVGSGTPGKKCAPWHDPEFRVDPHYTETAVPVLCASVLTR